MKDRIKQIMENENLSPTKFADRLEINRTVISHILNGRNNPSLDVVTKILSEMNYINPEWLLNGKGNMYKDGTNIESLFENRDLFTQEKINLSEDSNKNKDDKETGGKESKNEPQLIENNQSNANISFAKKISQIIIYYTDNTFETFIPR